MAACLADREPSSARPTMSAIAVTVPTPGMEVRMASRLARRGSAPIKASISAPRFSIAVSAARIWRLISTAAGRAVVAPSWLRRVVRAAASGLRLSQRIASIRQSTRSVLAKAPKASANSRERNGFPPRLQTQRGPRSRPPDPWGWPPPGIDPSQSDSGSLFIQDYHVKRVGAAAPEGLGVALRKGAGKRGPKRLKTLDGAGKIAVRRARA